MGCYGGRVSAIVCTGLCAVLAIASAGAMIIVAVWASNDGCDMWCDEDSEGAELVNEGYYECDGTL